MRVSDVAKIYDISVEEVLAKLKSLKLKAQDGNQELNAAVAAVLRRALGDVKKAPAEKPAKPVTEDKISKRIKTIAEEEPLPKAKGAKSAKNKTVKVPKETAVKKDIATKGKPEKKDSLVQEEKTAAKTKKPSLKKETLPSGTPQSSEGKASAIAPPAPPAEAVVKAPSQKETVIFSTPHRRGRPMPEAAHRKSETAAKPHEKIEKGLEKEPGEEIKKQEGPLKEIEISLPINAKDLAVRLQEKPSTLIKELLKKGILVNINQNLDEDVVKKLLEIFGFSLIKFRTKEQKIIDFHEEEDDVGSLQHRAPVVTFMGHVDHGKTSLLDRIRKTKVADKEHGGITQHIGAYSVNLPKGRITFLDTPGHEAFTAMRARGAHITDLVVLVVAADEGVMPQTDEAINHARVAEVPIVVALNKIDKKNADAEMVKKQLADRGLNPEDWGGKTIVAGVSAATGEGIDNLLEMILLEAELLELKANPQKKASGIVVEARLTHGRGAVATVIVQNGTLKEGSVIIVGPYCCKVKAMFDDHERPIKEAGPAMPAEILGLPGVPEAGEKFYAVDDERQAKEIAQKRHALLRDKRLQRTNKITLEDLYAQIKAGAIKELRIVLKADVQGSLEALTDNILKLSTDEVQVKLIHSGIGLINTSDIILAGASDAIIIGFSVDVDTRAKEELEKTPVDVRTYRVIYDAIKDIKSALVGMLEPKIKKKPIARIEVRQVFNLSRSGVVAGCFVQKGRVHRKANIDIVRNGKTIFSGGLSSLKRFKDDVRDVNEGFECGVVVQGFNDYQPGDVIEAYELEKIERTL